MKLLLTRAAKIRHEAGEIVEVSPAEAGFLLSTHSAVDYADPVKPRNPEDILTAEEQRETPEQKAQKKTTRKGTK